MKRETIDEFRARVTGDLASYTEGFSVRRAGEDKESIWLTRSGEELPAYIVTVLDVGIIELYTMDNGVGTFNSESTIISAVIAKINSLEKA